MCQGLQRSRMTDADKEDDWRSRMTEAAALQVQRMQRSMEAEGHVEAMMSGGKAPEVRDHFSTPTQTTWPSQTEHIWKV